MIIEMQTTTVKSRSLGTAERLFERALPARERLSKLAAFWRTEVGVLNQIISVWPYASLAERNEVREAEVALAGWPPDIREFVIAQESKIWTPAPFSPPLTPRRLGNIYEIRIYSYPAGCIPEVIKNWYEILDERLKYSPLVGAWYADSGPDHEWIHIWAYQNADERERIREATAKAGIWPISIVDQRLNRTPKFVATKMQNMLVVPARFSPLC